jgi:BirA family biotin operon repressor/biotin-[acetyl-CoA-carboxylase] ligase
LISSFNYVRHGNSLLRRRLLKLLSDGEFHSGETLGASLGVSRMAVWKHLRALREMGVGFSVVRGKGYCLPAALELLECDRILAGISVSTRTGIDSVKVLLQVDSTNNWLRERALGGIPSGTVCVAEKQLTGRGRRGRSWISPFAANLYLSLLWRSVNGASTLGGLSLVTGLAVMRALRSYGIDSVGLKWPNDIMAADAKLAGILIDVVGESSGPCAVIIGIGINVNMSISEETAIDQPWTDLQRLTGHNEISRNELAARILNELIPAINVFDAAGLRPFLSEWYDYDLVNGHEVDLLRSNECITGTACGIDEGGALLVDTGDGRRRFVSGEVSVRVTS